MEVSSKSKEVALRIYQEINHLILHATGSKRFTAVQLMTRIIDESRIAAAKAERERWIAAINEYANIANDRFTRDDLKKLITRLTDEERT